MFYSSFQTHMFPKSWLNSVYTAGFDMHVETCMFKNLLCKRAFRFAAVQRYWWRLNMIYKCHIFECCIKHYTTSEPINLIMFRNHIYRLLYYTLQTPSNPVKIIIGFFRQHPCLVVRGNNQAVVTIKPCPYSKAIGAAKGPDTLQNI